VRGEASKLAISVVRISDSDLNAFFVRYRCRDKYKVAGLMAKWFPETSWRLPSKPKFYDPEPRALLGFDSMALGAAYLDIHINDGQVPTNDAMLSPASK
jgi:hypothetical protein